MEPKKYIKNSLTPMKTYYLAFSFWFQKLKCFWITNGSCPDDEFPNLWSLDEEGLNVKTFLKHKKIFKT